MTHTERFDATATLAGLKAFQLDTVAHVVDRFYGDDPTRRFLVADETGLGKSIVARGVIARTIERLQDDDSINRVDVVYICSNTDLARQNLNRLDVTGAGSAHRFATRLTMLATQTDYLRATSQRWIKPVKLISFTPGTSFEKGFRTGKWQERALLFLLLEDVLRLRGARRTAALKLFKQGVRSWTTFRDRVEDFRADEAATIDEEIWNDFLDLACAAPDTGNLSTVNQLDGLVTACVGRSPTAGMDEEAKHLIGELRNQLARSSVNTLEPDLIILDEFQRFRDLITGDTEAGELAREMFEYPAARVLLLSATPYKAYTTAAESAEGDDHHTDFRNTITFLTGGTEGTTALVERIDAGLARLRTDVMSGAPSTAVTDELRADLLSVMCRAERPEQIDGELSSQVVEHVTTAAPIEPEDLIGYVDLKRIASEVDAPLEVEYWKSAPYFANFMDGYRIREKIRDALVGPHDRETVTERLAKARQIDHDAVRSFAPIDMGNARLRALAADTVEQGWEKLLWMPPTLPYLLPSKPFNDPALATMTKRLIFSSWAATPTAVASLLSYEATRRIAAGLDELPENTAEARARQRSRLAYRVDPGGRAAAMTTLALFWPMPVLAELSDPYRFATGHGHAVEAGTALRELAAQLRPDLPRRNSADQSRAEQWMWQTAFGWEGSIPGDDAAELVSDVIDGSAEQPNPERNAPGSSPAGHYAAALGDLRRPGGKPPQGLARSLAELAMHSPANCAWRALKRTAPNGAAVTTTGLWRAAAHLASGLRTLFSRVEASMLLDSLYGTDTPFWQRVLRYCGAGNLQATLDEYLFHLRSAEGIAADNDDGIVTLAERAVAAMSMRPATYRAFNPIDPDTPLALPSRFALRYGSNRPADDSARPTEVRHAFNSPFWPFVLASTSVGQEGIDFHWWCHSLVHWNLPSNPVDFEQREGRVNRFRGHAIRRNIVAAHRGEILTDGDPNPWSAAYRIAEASRDRLGGLSPDWVYPGPASIDRHILPYPLSSDGDRLESIKRDLALYRATLGQSRQEDMLAIMRGRGDSAGAVPRVDLSAPKRL